jgi:hypothetical protein
MLEALSLSPVIEFEPGRYQREGRAYPRVSSQEGPDAWQHYWLVSLSDAGIDELMPIRTASWLVATATLTRPATLHRLIERTLAACDLQAERLPDALDGSPLHECLSPLDGGFVIGSRGRSLAEPACCGDLGNLAGFRDALKLDDDGWHPIWTGHDGALVEARRGGLELRIDTVEYELSRGLLAAAINVASAELDAFERRLLSVAREIVPVGLSDDLARCLVGRSTELEGRTG